MITCKNIHAHELIGLNVTVRKSTDPTLEDLKGSVIYESKNMLIIKSKKIRMIPKKGSQFYFSDLDCLVDGRSLVGRPEDRIRRLN